MVSRSACLALFGFALIPAAGCSSSKPASSERLSTTSSAIQGGTNDTTDSFAVGIVSFGGSGGDGSIAVCSGAMIAPNLVMTARHCVSQVSSEQVDCTSDTFSAPYAASNFYVTNKSEMSQDPSDYTQAAQVIVPTDTHFCGNDLALIILQSAMPGVSTYVKPLVDDSMTDHTNYEKVVTAIGYGVTSAGGSDSGTRRIKQNIPVTCIPGDSTTTTICTQAQAGGEVADNEFTTGSGTCSGDSGSSAYEQANYAAGTPVSFGVLSRGGESGTTCEDAVYTRTDKWADLIRQTAQTAATMGGYAPPDWAGAAATDGGTSDPGSEGNPCNTNDECDSENCQSADGQTSYCVATCDPSNPSCDTGYTCGADQNGGNDCFPNAPAASTTNGATTVTTKSGCSVSPAHGPTSPVPWKSVAIGLGLAVALVRRRKKN